MRAGCEGFRRRDRRLREVHPCCKLSFAGGGEVRLEGGNEDADEAREG